MNQPLRFRRKPTGRNKRYPPAKKTREYKGPARSTLFGDVHLAGHGATKLSNIAEVMMNGSFLKGGLGRNGKRI